MHFVQQELDFLSVVHNNTCGVTWMQRLYCRNW